MKKKIVVIGGGTFEPIRNHLALSAPAFGQTAKSIFNLLKDKISDKYDIELFLTKMAGSLIPIADQKPFQCGSLECGLNTTNNLMDFGIAKAVYLDKHGPNILFKSTENPDEVIEFIKSNIQLGVKTT